jgi:PAS domain S-box-containing protein
VKTKQNDWRLFSVKAVPAFDKTGAIQQWVGVHTDITEQKLAEEKLAYRTALLEAHNEASVDGILLVDTKGDILSFNQRFIEIWNMPQHILDAKDDEAALSFAMTQLVNPQLFIDKVRYQYEYKTEVCFDELDFKNGKIVERNGYPVFGVDGNYYACSWTFRDITEQKNYEKIIIESEQRFRTLAETLPQLIWMTNEKGAYEYASSHWINYSGLDPYAGDTWEKLVHPHDLESLAQGWESSLKTGKTFNSEARLKNKNGMYSWHLVQGEPIKSEQGTIIKWIGAFTDIENLKEEQKQKNDFLSMASHELRTPVTTIKGYGQIIERLLEEKNDLQTLGFVKKMSKQVNRLNTLITDLLDITKMQRGGLIRNESVFNFNDLVKEVIDDMQKTTFTHQIIDNLNADSEIKGDKDKLSQVLNNLISNAIKYSPAADKIIVSTQIVKDGVQLSVEDFGIGISIEGQQHVFEQFYRVTGENQSTFQGMGIGLYICAEIIKKEGGAIWVESAGVKGSMFYVWLPVDHKDGTEV